MGSTDPKKKTGKKRMTKEERAKKKRNRIILIAVEVFVLLLMLIALYVVVLYGKIHHEDINEDDIVINDGIDGENDINAGDIATNEGLGGHMSGYRNVALFGVDARDKSLGKGNRTDTIIVASINETTKEVKLVSVYRDTYLNIGNDSYNKANSAYAKGGPLQAINMLNMNLDMNITDFVTVGFSGLTETIDALGGVYIDVKEEEISHLNNYQISIVGTTKDGKTYTAAEGSYTPVTQAGYQKLNGLQATAYCRIRYVGNDFERTARQRRVLKAVADEAKKASPAQLEKIANSVFDKVYTSLDISEIVSLLGNISKYNIVDEGGFPNSDMLTTGSIGKKGSCVVPRSLESNVTWLHEFLFDEKDYEPSSAVKEYSAKIAADTNGYVK